MIILILQLVMRAPFLSEPLDRDEGAYGYIGQRILAGEIPYRDVFDHKTPVVYYIYAFVIKAFGGTVLSIRLFSTFYSLLTTLAVFYLAYLIFNPPVALLAAGLFGIFSSGPMVQGTGANTEVFMILPLVLAFIFFLIGQREKKPAWLFWAGVLSGLAVMIKQLALFNFVVLLGIAFWPEAKRLGSKSEPRGLLAGSLLLSGFLVFPLAFLIYFSINNALSDFLYCTVSVNRLYASALSRFSLLDRLDQAIYMAKGVLREESLLWLGAFLLFFRIGKKEETWLLIWTGAAVVGVAAPMLFFGHYFLQLLPALVILAAAGFYRTFQSRKAWQKWAVSVLALILTIIVYRGESPYFLKLKPYQISTAKYGTDSFARAHYYSRDLAAVIPPDKTLLVWDSHPEIYYYLRKKSPARYIYWLPWMGFKMRDELKKEIYLNKPDYIFKTDMTIYDDDFINYVKKNYTLNRDYHARWKLFKRRIKK